MNIMVASNNDIPTLSMLDEEDFEEEKNKILVVDDEQFNHDVLKSFLKILEVQNRKLITDHVYDGH